MQLPELLHALRHLGLGGIATSLEARLVQAQADHLPPADFLALLVQDELTRRADRLLARRLKEAQLRDPDKTLDGVDFDFNKKMDRRLVFELATGRFLTPHDDVVFLGPPGTGKKLSRAGARPRPHPAGPPRPLPRGARAARGPRRRDPRRQGR